MKKILSIPIVCCLMAGCGSFGDKVKAFIPGTYVSSWETEFSKSVDTLVIRPQVNDGSETFQITKKTKVTFNANGRKKHPEYKVREWVAVYHQRSKTLFVTNDGSTLSFDTENAMLIKGTTNYRKISNSDKTQSKTKS